MIVASVAATALFVWIGLLLAHDGFWLIREHDDRDQPADPATWPDVTAIVPARDEAETIAATIAGLVAQDYPGRFRILLVDDGSRDGTARIAADAAAGSDRLAILTGTSLPAGWTGKLWAVSQGVAQAGDGPDWLLLTDADIVHAPDLLRRLVARGVSGDRVLVSLMARLRCTSLAERALVPAFIFFFRMLYPFARVNRRGRGLGAAAGGCMLVDRRALARAGGVAAVRGALIDDCAFGALLKAQGAVWLGLTDRAVSIRRYDGVAPVAAMIARSAYAQLSYSPVRLAGTIAGLGIVFLSPPLLALFAHGWPRAAGLVAWLLMAAAFQPMLRFYHRSPLWGAALPAIAAFYTGCTLLSAWQHARGRGGQWKGRVQAAAGR